MQPYLVGLPTLAFITFSTTETKYMCLLHILLPLITFALHRLLPCLYIVLCYVVYPRGINAFWNFQIHIRSVLFSS